MFARKNIFITQTVVQYFCIVYLNRSRRKPIAIIASSKKEGKIESSCSLSGISLSLSLFSHTKMHPHSPF
jgi:hypothetical protein